MNGIDLYIATGKQKHGEQETAAVVLPADAETGSASALATIKQKLKTEKGRAFHKMRKAIVEPVFGQIKQQELFPLSGAIHSRLRAKFHSADSALSKTRLKHSPSRRFHYGLLA